MTARSFSIPTTVPLTTAPSCGLPWVKDSSSICAKSSRVGLADWVAMAMNSPEVTVDVGFGWWRFGRKSRGPRGPSAIAANRITRAAEFACVRVAQRDELAHRNDGSNPARPLQEAGGAGSSSNDGSAVSRASGLLGRLRQYRGRPGTRRLYPNAWYRASAP